LEVERGAADLAAATAAYGFGGEVPNSYGTMMVKEYRRAAAGEKIDIPELCRTPSTLRLVVGYLERCVMDLYLQ
jgi:hypothetical protein